MLAVGALVNGRYEVTGLIGRGGMSFVYSAVDKTTGRALAIKEAVRKGKIDNRTTELNFVAEGNLLKRLSNSHLPKIYDVIEQSDQIMIVMDYVEGESLDKLLARNERIPIDHILNWSIQICDVFHYLHTQNPPIIYRDMKPSNVILQPNGHIMMIDFGTARTWKLDAGRTSDTILIGTEGFAAPEQFGGHGQSDARTDIFCLGATIFNLVTGHSPYTKPFGITPLGQWDVSLKDSELDRIIQKCTAQDPFKRYQTAYELKQDLLAAKESLSKTRLFSLAGRSNTVKNSGWQTPIMKKSDGASRRLQLDKGTRSLKTTERKEANILQENKQDNRKVVSSEQRKATPPLMSGERVNHNQEETNNDTKDIWKKIMIVALAAGFVLLILSILLFVMSPVTGVIVLVIAALVVAFGIVCVMKYIHS